MRKILLSFITAFALVPVCSAAVPVASGNPEILPFTILEGKVAYFKPGEFTSKSVRTIRPTMKAISETKPRGLVIDLRNNMGGDVGVVHALLEALLPKGTPYMRFYSSNVKRLAVTEQPAVFKKSTPVVVLRDHKTVNEPDIAVYALQKIRKAGVLEFSPQRAALQRIYKQNSRMDNFRPIKEAVFFVVPDVRIIGSEGGGEEDMIPRSVIFIKELSPFDEKRTAMGR